MLSRPEFMQKQILFALLNKGEKISFKNDNIVIKKEQTIIHQSSCYRLFSLIVVGNTTITTGLLQRAEKFKFSLIFCNYNLRPYAQFQVQTQGNVILRKQQYQYHSLQIAQHLIQNKIEQQSATLKKIRAKTLSVKNTLKSLKKYHQRLPDYQLGLQDILGIEGIASRVYFKSLFASQHWLGRKPRTKIDINNTLLDIGYTLLFNMMETLINLYGFDIYQGVYHQTFYQRKSLVCDLIEPVRPIIDWRIRKAYQLNQIDPKDFLHKQNQFQLVGESSKKYTALLLQEILSHKESLFLFIQNYYRCFMRQKPIEQYPKFQI